MLGGCGWLRESIENKTIKDTLVGGSESLGQQPMDLDNNALAEGLLNISNMPFDSDYHIYLRFFINISFIDFVKVFY